METQFMKLQQLAGEWQHETKELRAKVRSAAYEKTGLRIERDYLREELRRTQEKLTEEEEDLADALCPVYDQLDIAKGWWTLEIIPLMQRYQKTNNEWVDALLYVYCLSFHF